MIGSLAVGIPRNISKGFTTSKDYLINYAESWKKAPENEKILNAFPKDDNEQLNDDWVYVVDDNVPRGKINNLIII